MNSISFPERLLLGGKTTLIGMLVVFVGLAILIGCITLMGIMARDRKKQKTKEEPAAAEVKPSIESAVEEEVAEENDDALIAVITAAVATVWDKKDTGFTVRRVRRCR